VIGLTPRVGCYNSVSTYRNARTLGIEPRKSVGPLPTKGGGTLRTIGEACAYMTSMGKKREVLNHWQRVAKLVLAKEDVMTVSRALELALFMDAKLEVSQI
jgi:hypothetical protein